jgi:2,4-dienoyl-CoA reductase (NADPH2)
MLEHLLSPFRIGSMELRNRIAMAPMGVEIVEGDGKVREPVVRYYEERARGGVGLLISENTSACYPRGANSAHELGVSSDDFIPGLRELAARVQRHGAKLALQLAHHGKVGRLDTQHGREVLMPSHPRKHPLDGPLDLTIEEMTAMAKAAGGGKPKVREATLEDLEQLVAEFGDAAARVQEAGIDAVEIHGAHGYIFSEFLSRGWNFREDGYGGSVENRARLLCDVVRECKRRTGGDFPVWARIDAVEYRTQDGIELADAQRTAELLAEAGADAVHVSAYSNPMGAGFTEGPLVHREAGYVDFAAAIKQRVKVPVIAVGRIEPELGDRLIRDGKADIISMGRKLLADPALAQKLTEGRPEDVRPCVYCYTCVAQPFFDRRVRCAVNPVTANEQELADLERTHAAAPKRVMVVGSGPAGMEAARVAAARGHRVTLVEKATQLGGTLRFAALMYEPNERLLRWLETQVRKADVDVQLERRADAALVERLAPDVVLVAAGASRERPDVPGIDSEHVFDGDDLRALLTGEGAEEAAGKLSLAGRLAVKAGRLTGVSSDPAKLREASKAYMPVGKRVCVVGGGLVGVELAEFLAERGRKVCVLEEGPVFATEMAHPRRWRVLYELREAGVELIENARVVSIEGQSVEAAVGDEGAPRSVAADTVILASGLLPNPDVARELSAAGVPIVEIGDVTGVGYIEGAIHDGYRAAVEI